MVVPSPVAPSDLKRVVDGRAVYPTLTEGAPRAGGRSSSPPSISVIPTANANRSGSVPCGRLVAWVAYQPILEAGRRRRGLSGRA